MPNCFQLIDKKTGEAAILQEIDNRLWEHFEGAIPDPNDKWYLNWFNTLSVLLSMGRTFEEIKVELSNDIGHVIDYIETYYTARSWTER